MTPTAHPEGTLASVIPPDKADATTRVVLSVPGLGEKERTVFVDPYTGRVKGVLTTWFDETPLMTWFDDLHRNLHLGEVGRLYSELAASWLWVIVTGGLVLWLGRRRHYRGDASAWRALLPIRSARGVRRVRGRHAVTGLWLATGLLFLSATGLTWSNHAGGNFQALLDAVRGQAPEVNTALAAAPASGGNAHHGGGSTATPATDPAHTDRVLNTARVAGLAGPVKITPPEEAGHAWSVVQEDNLWPVRRDQVAIDPASGQITDRADWAEYPVLAKLSALGIQAHMGLLFGLANQLLLAAIAIGLLTLIFFGYRMWWQRRPTRDDRRGLLGKPPARGTWRTLPRPFLFLGIPLLVALGWALPVFGVTLLAFLAIDLIVGFGQRRSGRTRTE
ncbi:PepSY-associated TM helix domain-containing protein [Actinomadura alba]|uniref:PepSY domain-containing protein n=1 Tax=Actinomadura alba TaxID=406431 RepID=A0ABR7LRK2_9ACTN|nr:PepSY domain-containing protein [Actinomadura alba]MBC6467298.1 PepSY domain-containing protein [Actinomadura alba]